MTWFKSDGNWRFVVPGALLVAAWLVVISALLTWTAMTVDKRLNPRGQPFLIDALSFAGDQPVVAGRYAWLSLVVQQLRDCEANAQMIYVNPAGEERVFRLADWPLKDRGEQQMRIPVLVPDLYPGGFKAQIRGLWRCQEEIYPVTSPIVDVEIVAAEPQPPSVP